MIGINCYSQQVDVFDQYHKKVFKTPVELKDVGELMKDYHGEFIYIQFWGDRQDGVIPERKYKRVNSIEIILV